MQIRYTPILRWKQGERIALSHLSPGARVDVTPNLVLTQAQFDPSRKGKTASKSPKKSPPPPSEYLAKQIADAWGKTTFYLDVSDLPGTHAKHVLDDIAAKANAAGLSMAPSIKLNAPSVYAAAVSRVVKHDGRGVALRIPLDQMSSAATWMGSWPFPFAETDLIIDLAASVATVLALGQPIHAPFKALHQATAWRSVTLAGGNIPANLSGYTVGLTMLPRAEMQLWASLKGANLDYQLHFGDYATIGPDAITEGIEGPVPINAKYTIRPDYAVFHGVKTKGPGSKPRDQQYRSYASQIVKLANRNALAHCWGDQMIDQIASSHASSPGSPASWVSYSVNRHIELTRTQLP
jgi:hypothetical protein